ncbi:MAG: anthranilate phosphoribosyltransferase [Alphaproteobacteria bacterium]
MSGQQHLYLEQLLDGKNLSSHESRELFMQIMEGLVDPLMIAGILAALRAKGEHVDELTGAVEAMRSHMTPVDAPTDILDTCGTGGDRKGTLNISTATALVVAGAGVKVAKHGNRSVSSRSGSADVLEQLGVPLNLTATQESAQLHSVGMTFLMAPNHHAAMKHVVPVRKALKTRTIFNLLGPLSNPARAKRQLIGVYDRKWLKPFATVLARLGSHKAWIVHGHDGLDEITLGAPTDIAQLKDGEVTTFTLNPNDYGVNLKDPNGLIGGLPEQNAQAIDDLLHGADNDFRKVVLLNSAAALMVAEKAIDFQNGLELAALSIDGGAALRVLQQLRVE